MDPIKPDAKKALETLKLNLRVWHASIPNDRYEEDEFLRLLGESVLPWLEVSEKLAVHIHMQASSITALRRKGNETEDSVRKLTERVGPIIALKEDVDEVVSRRCERLLEKLETANERSEDGE